MEMGSLAQPSFISKSTQKQSKIPEYAKDFKNEWLYITGINRKCGEFMKKLGDNTDSFEKVFWSSRARALLEILKMFWRLKKWENLKILVIFILNILMLIT